MRGEKRGKTDPWVRLLVRECGVRQRTLFPFSFILWNNTCKERRSRKTGMFSREILPTSRL